MEFFFGDNGRLYPFPLEEDLGEYSTEIDHELKAVLKLKAKLTSLSQTKVGEDLYVARFTFSGRFEEKDYQALPAPEISFEINKYNLEDIFERIIRSAEGIETFFSVERNWKISRPVLRAIFSLEEKTKHLFEAGKKANDERVQKLLRAREIAIEVGEDRIDY